MRQVVYRVAGLDGSGGDERVADVVGRVEGVDRVGVTDGAVEVVYDEGRTTGGTIAARIAEAGYEVVG